MGQRWRCAAVTLFQLTFLDEAGGGGEGLGEGPGVTRQLAPGLLYIDTDKKQQQNTINTNNKVSTRCGYMGKMLVHLVHFGPSLFNYLLVLMI